METQSITKTSKIKTVVVCCLITFLIAFTVSCFGQDTIVKINGERVFGKVIAFTPEVIEYKKIDSLPSKTYTERNTDVSEVRFKNGFIETFKNGRIVVIADSIPQVKIQVSKPKADPKLEIHSNVFIRENGRLNRLGADELRDLARFKNNPELNLLVEKSEQNKVKYLSTLVGIPVVFVGAGMMFGSMFSDGKNFNNSVKVVIAGSIICDFNIYFFLHGKKLKRKIAKKYNETF